MDLPKCQKCNNGILIPLSDYGQDGAAVIFKAWACTNPTAVSHCGWIRAKSPTARKSNTNIKPLLLRSQANIAP